MSQLRACDLCGEGAFDELVHVRQAGTAVTVIVYAASLTVFATVEWLQYCN